MILRDITLRQVVEKVLRKAENAQANEAVRLYQHERTIASAIQQRLFPSALPSVPFASVRGRNIACQDVGGDFYDMIATPEAVAVVIADACGKGISAALQSSILQGII